MSETQDNASTIIKLRSRMQELLRLGVLTSEGFGMYQQTVLQLLQEYERRKASCLEQAEHFRRQAAAVEAQAAAFGVSASVLFSVVNGYIDIEERRAREMAERAAEEKASREPEPAEEPASSKKRKKKAPEPASEAPAAPEPAAPGAVSDAPDEG